MTHVHHSLAEEFPGQADLISKLNHSDAHFAKLAREYDDVNHKVYRIEAGLDPTSDEFLETLKKQRLKLKDDIAALLARASSG